MLLSGTAIARLFPAILAAAILNSALFSGGCENAPVGQEEESCDALSGPAPVPPPPGIEATVTLATQPEVAAGQAPEDAAAPSAAAVQPAVAATPANPAAAATSATQPSAAAATSATQPPAAAAAPAVAPAAPAGPHGGPSVKDAIDRGTNWLLRKQNPDGGYGPSFGVKDTSDVGLTAFALYALARSPRKYKEHDGPFISKAVDFILARQQADGAIYDPKDPSLQNYKTSVAILALTALDRAKYAGPIAKAAGFIKSQQATEERGYEKGRHLSYGGIGYGGEMGKEDNSNMTFSLEALREAGVSGADDLWIKARVFVARTINTKVVDPLVKAAGVGTTGDGGARYQPAGTRGPVETIDGDQVFSSYGSMTYAALKSLLYTQLRKEDPLVQGLVGWIRSHWTVKENPGMATSSDPAKGQQGLFYYYHTMAKALAALGEPVIVDDRGVKHVWAKDLGEHLVSIQRPDGSWDNPAERWMEGIEVLDTAYAIVTLTVCKEELDRQAAVPVATQPPAAAGAAAPAAPPVGGTPAPAPEAGKK
jgi:squalene-hopene/tetraprenyl-beta-curcumene cyclase